MVAPVLELGYLEAGIAEGSLQEGLEGAVALRDGGRQHGLCQRPHIR